MRAEAATRPAAPLSTNAKIALGIGSAAVLALLYAVGSSSSSSAPAAAAGGSGPGPVGPPPSNKSGAPWTPSTSLVKGQTYRVSGDAVDALSSLGFAVYTDHDTIPGDWPAGDHDPKRWRIEGVWTAPTTTLAALLPSLPGDLRVWEWDTGAAALGGGGSWVSTTTLTQGKRVRASLDVRADLSALGFQIWDQYDALPADWPAGDAGSNRWHVEGPWLSSTMVYSPSAFASTLRTMGVPNALAQSIAQGARFWTEG